MIDFEYWIANIVGTCELIASDEAFRKVWVNGEHALTSIHYYDELYVQLSDALIPSTVKIFKESAEGYRPSLFSAV